MKLAGFLLLLSGWGLLLSALALLPSSFALRAGFALTGFAIQLLGITLVIRSHIPARREDRG